MRALFAGIFVGKPTYAGNSLFSQHRPRVFREHEGSEGALETTHRDPQPNGEHALLGARLEMKIAMKYRGSRVAQASGRSPVQSPRTDIVLRLCTIARVVSANSHRVTRCIFNSFAGG